MGSENMNWDTSARTVCT